ncbi:MAG: PAS domain-containing protein [Proteobacteria bacterium]|nr:PAS domain-containing protein [Pseudomonadota bacterium]
MTSGETKNQKPPFDFESAFNAISDFVTVHDNEFRIIRANKSLCDFLGKTPDRIIGQRCYRIFHGKEGPWPECPHMKAVERKTPVTEMMETNSLGIPLLITCSPLFDEKGFVLGTVHVARDVSRQKLEAKEKEDLIQELEKALMDVRKLSGIIPICTSCKKIRDDQGYWQQIEQFISEHTQMNFSHGICPNCVRKLYPDLDFKSLKF